MTMFTADGLYGPNVGSRQATSTPVPEHSPGEAAPHTRTIKPPGKAGLLHDPILMLVALLGIGFLILHVSLRGSVEVRAGK